ncbi:hypothetical protein JTM29_24730 [Pseudomonas aeruginosa]|nr:hypothetical protein [Pseudomonas aeruginosa]
MNMFLKFMALILCGGASVAIAFMRFKVLMEPEVALIFFTIGAVISLIVGVPLLLLLEWRFHRYRLRYVVGGLVCSLLGWLIFEGAFFPGAWEKIWTSSFFWNPAFFKVVVASTVFFMPPLPARAVPVPG